MRVEIDYGTTFQPVRIGLRPNGQDIVLGVIGADGNVATGGYLIHIRQDGTFYLHHGVNPKHGFKLDHNGAIKIEP